jgi:hypothetical protein
MLQVYRLDVTGVWRHEQGGVLPEFCCGGAGLAECMNTPALCGWLGGNM